MISCNSMESRLNRVTSVTHSNIDSKKESVIPHTTAKQYGVGITGFDRITNPHYNFKAKLCWGLLFVGFTCAAFYQSYSCLYEYRYGKPAVVVDFSKRDIIPIPDMLLCPMEFFGINPGTNNLKKEYKEVFNIKDVNYEIAFSDLLNLPNMTMEKLWKHQQINYRFEVQCSTRKNDYSCIDTKLQATKVINVGGECIKSPDFARLKVMGPVTFIILEIMKPTKKPESWSMVDFYSRVFDLAETESSMYTEFDRGVPSTLSLHGKVSFSVAEIVNLNLSHYPCETSDVVERCVDTCFEEMMYSQITCRLPFINNKTLKDCDTPETFNKTFEIIKKLIRHKKECRKKCPRKCFEYLFNSKLQAYLLPAKSLKAYIEVDDQTVQSIREEPWYTFSSLTADIGGSFGFFLDITVLTLIEIVEFLFTICRKWKEDFQQNRKGIKIFYFTRRNRMWMKKAKNAKEGTNQQPPNIGIIGCDRIFSDHSSRFQKVMWTLMIILSTAACSFQIYDTVFSFLYGKPDVKLIVERNDTVQYPTLTVCPYRPYHYWNFILNLKVSYADDFNISEEDTESISISDLMKLEEQPILKFWNVSGVTEELIKDIDINCQEYTKTEPDDEIVKVEIEPQFTIYGRCLSLIIRTPVRFRGTGTLICYQLNEPETSIDHPYIIFLHNPEEDPRTVNPNAFIFPTISSFGFWSINVRKKELVSRPWSPCLDSYTVSQCRSECYDFLLHQKAPCRLPFMKHSSLKLCNSSSDFNKTMELAISFTTNYSEFQWCNCTKKCSEYIYSLNHDDTILDLGMTFPLIVFVLQFPSNLITVSQQYFQMNLNNLLANICGSLGLFLGFNALTVVEILEAIFLLWNKRKICKI